jgi:hypothetical protein
MVVSIRGTDSSESVQNVQQNARLPGWLYHQVALRE